MNRNGLPLLVLAVSAMGLGIASLPAHAKSAFDADPGQSGLLIADVRLRHKTLFENAEAGLRHGVVVRMDEPTADPIGGDPESGVLVFAVGPGQWRLAGALAEMRLGQNFMRFDLRFPPDSLPELTRQVAPGAVVYIGRVESQSLPHLASRTEIHSSVSYDRGREIKVLQKLQSKAKKSAWAEKLSARIAELSGTAEGSVSADSTGR